MRQQRRAVGSVRFDKRRGTWNYLFYDHGKRRSKLIGTKHDYPTKAAAWKAVAVQTEAPKKSTAPTVLALVEQFRVERMPKRYSTRRGYESWFKNHIVPAWGNRPITDVQARPVELWLCGLPLSPKSRVHVRTLIRELWDFAMWAGHIPIERNPMELVTIKGASKRTRKPRSLTVEEFHRFIRHLEEPFRTLALVCVCFGLRISECLALRWSDVDWLNGKLKIERGIVRQHVDDVKTVYSGRLMAIDAVMLEVLKTWKQTSQFSTDDDWIFASPAKIGRLPWSYPYILRLFHSAATSAGVGNVATHTMRHSFRSWLDSVGTAIAVQQKMMRHASITTTLDVYGDVVTDEMAEAHGKVVGLALNGAQTERKAN
jgi:integrase